MPVPTLITDLSTTAASNYPQGSEAPGPDGDNHIRALGAFIAQLYDGTTSVSAGIVKSDGSTLSAASAGTDYLAPAAIGVTVQAYDADIPTEIISQADAEAGTGTVSKAWTAERVAQAIAAQATVRQSVISYTGTGGIASKGAIITSTVVLPIDDTIPQSSEGAACLDCSITTTKNNTVVEVEVVLYAAITSANHIIAALFKDSDASAVAATALGGVSTNSLVPLVLKYQETIATPGTTTWKVRVGPGSASAVTVNGVSGARLFGGVMASYIKVSEISYT